MQTASARNNVIFYNGIFYDASDVKVANGNRTECVLILRRNTLYSLGEYVGMYIIYSVYVIQRTRIAHGNLLHTALRVLLKIIFQCYNPF